MKTMIRCNAIDMSSLAAQEMHGKRLDKSSQRRVIRDASPLVAGSLDLRARYDQHMDGVKQNKGAKKPVLHFLVRFPPDLLDEDAKHFRGNKTERQKMMLRQAIKFVNSTHGGNAVFAARVDRDEAGETIVDVFAAPKYIKESRSKKPRKRKRDGTPDKPNVWASATKFGKDLAEKHQEEIQRRHPEAKSKLLGPRAVGIALNTEWRDWFSRVNDIDLAAKIEKASRVPDRIETEAYKEVQAERDEVEHMRAVLRKERDAFEGIKDRVIGLVRAFSETFGLPLPKKLRAAVTALEEEISARMPAPESPFAEQPSNDMSPLS
jgi:hypothetical protein